MLLASITAKSTAPPAFPAPLEVTVPPDVVMSPPIVIFPVVLPDPGFLISANILTSPPAPLSLPEVSISESVCDVKDPAPGALSPITPCPSSLAPVTSKRPPWVTI